MSESPTETTNLNLSQPPKLTIKPLTISKISSCSIQNNWKVESSDTSESITVSSSKDDKLDSALKSVVNVIKSKVNDTDIDLDDLENQSLDCLKKARSYFKQKLKQQALDLSSSEESQVEKSLNTKDKCKNQFNLKENDKIIKANTNDQIIVKRTHSKEDDKNSFKCRKIKKDRVSKGDPKKSKHNRKNSENSEKLNDVSKKDKRKESRKEDDRKYRESRNHRIDDYKNRDRRHIDNYRDDRIRDRRFNDFNRDNDRYRSRNDKYHNDGRYRDYRDDKGRRRHESSKTKKIEKNKSPSPPPLDIDFDDNDETAEENEVRLINERRLRLNQIKMQHNDDENLDQVDNSGNDSEKLDGDTDIEEEFFDFNETVNLKQNNILNDDVEAETETSSKTNVVTYDMFSNLPTVGVDGGDKMTDGIHNWRKVSNLNAKNLADNWDDSEGYYRPRIGEIINEKYSVINVLGQGVFSIVVSVKDTLTLPNSQVAIKIIRNNDLMLNTGMKELETLKKINEMDPKDKFHCLRLLGNFKYRNHLCIVTELFSMNLRQVLKKFGKNIGLHIKAIRSYTHQLLLALRLLKKCAILHADIKPDNILVDESKLRLKLCDFGSACPSFENDITPYLVSRFYRAPEIVLGSKYDFGIDMWSTACTLFEMYTGKILFPGKSNNQMLKLMIDVNGAFHRRLLRRCHFIDQHFDPDFNFCYVVVDKVTDKEKYQIISNSQQPIRKLTDELILKQKLLPNELVKVRQFVALLTQMLNFDPLRRLAPSKALSSDFILQKMEDKNKSAE